MIYATLLEVAAEPGIDRIGIDRFLMQPTAEQCRFCGRQNLRKFEVLNGCRCESCRLRYLEAAGIWDDERCFCRLPPGWTCSSGIHHGEHGRAAARKRRFPDGREATEIDLCPIYRRVWKESRRREERKRPGTASPIDLGEFES